MKYALKERIGDPSLFCGRKQEMELLMNWVNMIPKELANSRTLLGRRKCGKSAIMQRLFNILWDKNGAVIPFYFEVRACNQWLLSFADVYYRTFMSQYLSFKTRTVLDYGTRPWRFAELISLAKGIKNNNALKDMEVFQNYLDKEQVEQARDWAFSAPEVFAGKENVFFLVMIDEIQFMSRYVHYDKAYDVPVRHFGLVESKVAPMLVSGKSFGGQTEISSKLTFDEGLETIHRYAERYQVEVTDESVRVINQLTQSDPFYIASLLKSDWLEKDLSTVEGVIKTLDYEIQNRKGALFGTWADSIESTIKADQYTKEILLFLSQERDKECTLDEINDHLEGALSEGNLEETLYILESADLISRGSNYFRYQGINDDILDMILRHLYAEEVYQVKPSIAEELAAKVNAEL